ncbi:UDP-N-acetylmuramoyl-tripeptide--D-alanyl-D-alanine ligase [Bacteroidales bacterium OttesenSCG-928-A17]|nr:UDP-N-acetylmuramoyl-tripeptide--D-alanyl-D-alanine ligase [Bacteroidales bacterium OttesenSCG-928-A17]
MKIPELYTLFRKHPQVTTDSRNCPENSIFFALKGENFDGNDYVEAALRNGASYAVCDRKELSGNNRIILVEDSLKALQDLAAYHRKQINPVVIAITGTNGKTTTKELTAAVLSSQFQTLYTKGNFNNHIGVPLTLLNLKEEDQFAVIEMGANHPGEIRELCEIADPDFGLITNIGKAHLDGFGSFEGVIRTKTELYDFIRNKGGKIFANTDNPILNPFLPSLNIISYGQSEQNDISGKVTVDLPFLEIEWLKGEAGSYKISTHLTGAYNFENVLAAVCIGSYFGISSKEINDSIENYFPSNNRSQHIETGKNVLIADAYNANPSSMQAALANFFRLNACPKMVILGEMKELGSYSQEEHQAIIRLLKDHPIDKICLIGDNFAVGELPADWSLFREMEELKNYLQEHPVAGYHILIKGSRSNRLETVIEAL